MRPKVESVWDCLLDGYLEQDIDREIYRTEKANSFNLFDNQFRNKFTCLLS